MKCEICGKDNLSLKCCNKCHTVFCWSCGLGKNYPLKLEHVNINSVCPKCGSSNVIIAV